MDDLHRVEGFTACIRRADILASSARCARPAVDEITPCQVSVIDCSKRLNVQIVKQDCLTIFATGQRLHGCHWPHVMEKHIREGHDKVHVL